MHENSELLENSQAVCTASQLMVFRGCYYSFSSADVVSKEHILLPDMAWQMTPTVRASKRSYRFLKVVSFALAFCSVRTSRAFVCKVPCLQDSVVPCLLLAQRDACCRLGAGVANL